MLPSFLSVLHRLVCAATFYQAIENGVNGCQRIAVLGETAAKLIQFFADFSGR
jgi:hypothetical protein